MNREQKENMMDDHLPPVSTDNDTSVKPIERVYHIGEDASYKLLNSLLTDVDLKHNDGILIVELGNRSNGDRNHTRAGPEPQRH